MKLLKLSIENFMCHEKSHIDFTEFSSALIVGKIENNDLYSNGVGKTTIFKAIEYCLFNQSDFNLDKIVREDCNSCNVQLDFIVNDVEYRISRTRTKKGTSDLSLFKKNEDWQDISGRRTSDTEKDIAKLIKITFKSFRSTIHFLQNDFSGLTTATIEKRKGILKEAFNLLIYSKLEKIAKDKSNAISKEIDKIKIIIESIGNPEKDLIDLEKQLKESSELILIKNSSQINFVDELTNINININNLNSYYSNLESNFSSLIASEKQLTLEKNKIEISVKEYQSKKTNVSKSAKEIIEEINILKDEQSKLLEIDYSKIDTLNSLIIENKEKIAFNSANISNCIKKYDDLNIPFPEDGSCKHCRQLLSIEHRNICQKQIEIDKKDCQLQIQQLKKDINLINSEITKSQYAISELTANKNKLENINSKITAKTKELSDKKSLYEDYTGLYNKFTNELNDKISEINDVTTLLKGFNLDEANSIKLSIEEENKKISNINNKLSILNKDINHISNTCAVIKHNIQQKEKDKLRLADLKKQLKDLEIKNSSYPIVIQAFSSKGIPNLIIQNILDDLQIESNNLLSQLKPGLQLSFFIEKTKGDGSEDDTLDILYHINGKERSYEQLSGAMQLAATFSLKLGLSFLLQKMIGTDIKFLLLDEIDQPLDKAGVDAFSDIVKYFQNEFTILIITHNDRLKDKFSHAILVEQDKNMISNAKVVSNW